MANISHINTFLFPLAKNAKGITSLNNIWEYLYGSNEEKTDRFNVEFVRLVVFLLITNDKYKDHIIMARIPIELRDECSISMKCDGILYEYVYIIDGTKTDDINIEYIDNSNLKKYQNIL